MFLLVTHAIYIIMIMANCIRCHRAVLYYVITFSACHVQKSNGTRRCSTFRRHCLIKLPVAWCRAGWARATHVDFCPVCHRIHLTRSVFVFGATENTPNIIRTRCKRAKHKTYSPLDDHWVILTMSKAFHFFEMKFVSLLTLFSL